jgi:3-demethoxyubiquinol 3-hydroxylase
MIHMPKPINPVDTQACSVVLFDGSCPLCNISAPQYSPLKGVSRETLMHRFHTITPSGELLSGANAFVHMWSLLPGWRHLAYFAKRQPLLSIMEMMYRLFLLARPWMQSAHRRLFPFV